MCKKCGRKIIQSEVYRSSTCEFCGSALYSCVNCKFHSPGSHYDCHESVEELVKDKESANFCDFFSVNKADFGAENNSINSKNSEKKAGEARAAFNALFGD